MRGRRTGLSGRSLSRVVPLAILVATAGADRLEACSCVFTFAGSHPCHALWQADATFAGRPVAVETLERRFEESGSVYSERRFRFAVDEGFRGVETGDEVEVWTGMGGGDCGYDFKLENRYVVYAQRGEDGRLNTGICGRTRRAGQAGDDLRYGRRIARGERPSMLYGIAASFDRVSADEYAQPTPITGATIRVEGPEGRAIRGRTDSEGRFELELPGAGSYAVHADWSTVAPTPDTPLPPAARQQVSVAEGRCAAVEIAVDRPPRSPAP